MIKFVYFDVGGVVIKDFTKTDKFNELKKAMGLSPETEPIFMEEWAQHRGQICIDYDVDNFLPFIKQSLHINLPDTYSLLQNFVDRFEKNDPIWPILSDIKKIAKTGLLTNMYPRMLSTIQKKGIFPPSDWDVVIDSSVVGYQKPDKRFFEIAEERAEVKHDEILFIDNQEKHVDAAHQFGWQIFYYDSGDYKKSNNDLRKLLDHIGLR